MACGTAAKGVSALLNHLQEKHGSHMKPSHYKKRLSEWIRLPLEDLPDSNSFDEYFLPRYEMARKLSSHPIIKGLPPPVLGFVCKCGHGCPPRIRSGSSSERKSVIEIAKTALRSHGKACPELTASEFGLRASGPLVPLQAFSTTGNGARYFQVTQDVKEVGAPLPASALTPADKYLREVEVLSEKVPLATIGYMNPFYEKYGFSRFLGGFNLAEVYSLIHGDRYRAVLSELYEERMGEPTEELETWSPEIRVIFSDCRLSVFRSCSLSSPHPPVVAPTLRPGL